MTTYEADKLNDQHLGKAIRFAADDEEHRGILAGAYFEQDVHHWQINYTDDTGAQQGALVPATTPITVED